MQVKLRVKPQEAVASPSASSDPVSLDLLPGSGAEASRAASEAPQAPGPDEAMPQLDPSLMQGSLLSMLQGLDDDDEAVEEQAPEAELQPPPGGAEFGPPTAGLPRDQTPELQQDSQPGREQVPGRDRASGGSAPSEPGRATAAEPRGLPPADPHDRAESLYSEDHTAMSPPEGSAPVSWSEDADQDSGHEDAAGASAQHGIEEHGEHADAVGELALLLAGGSPQEDSAASMDE